MKEMINYIKRNALQLLLQFLLIVMVLPILAYLVCRAYVLYTSTCIFDLSTCSDSCASQLNINELINSSIALIALSATFYEYRNHVKKRKADTLAHYNTLYCENGSYKKIIKDLIAYDEGKIFKYDIKSKADNNECIIYEREMFMRFFEEIQIQIEEGNLDSKTAKILFLWYAKKVDELGDNFISDYNSDCWTTFKKFIKR